jgi:hypothetical protein
VVRIKRNGVVIASCTAGPAGSPVLRGVETTVNFPDTLELRAGGQTVAGPIFGP